MYLKIYNSLDERYYMEQSDLTYREVSGGVYFVEKDRHDDEYCNYVNPQSVVASLTEYGKKVLVIGIHGTYGNFDAKGKKA